MSHLVVMEGRNIAHWNRLTETILMSYYTSSHVHWMPFICQPIIFHRMTGYLVIHPVNPADDPSRIESAFSADDPPDIRIRRMRIAPLV